MVDEAGDDAKVLCVLHGDPRWDHVREIEDVPDPLRAEIGHFFEVYKMLEPDKYSDTRGYESTAKAWAEIDEALARYKGT